MPFYVRAGKRLPVTATEVVVELRAPPAHVFDERSWRGVRTTCVSGSGRTSRSRSARARNSPARRCRAATSSCSSAQEQGDAMEAYERLIGDAMSRRLRRCSRAQDEVEAAWAVVDPVLRGRPGRAPYEPGTWGPPGADDLIDGPCGWHEPGADARGWTRACDPNRALQRRRHRPRRRRLPGAASAAHCDHVRILRQEPLQRPACRRRRPRTAGFRTRARTSGVTLTASRPSGRCTAMASRPCGALEIPMR